MDVPPPRVHPTNRVVPAFTLPHHVEHLRWLLGQSTWWVPRGAWPRWLEDGDTGLCHPIDDMLRDERIAALSWIVQQQHVLHRLLVDGGGPAPVDWADELPLSLALRPHAPPPTG
jgi:hypothetical protein